MHDGFDCDDVHVELGNLTEDFGLVVGSILIPSRPFALKSLQCPMTWMKRWKLHGKF